MCVWTYKEGSRMQVSQEVRGKIDSLYNEVVCLKFSFSDASVVFLYYFLI